MSTSPATSNGPSADQRPLIFAVDDEPMLLELASMILQPQGFRVETFRDPLAAVRAFSLANPLPALIANNYGEMMSIPLYDAALLGAALVLLVVILIFNILSTLVLQRFLRRS